MTMTRRQVLRGIGGATLALPFLDSLRADDESPRRGQPPTRLVAMAFALGVMTDAWWARGRGADMELGYSLEPLRPVASDMILVEGLRHSACIPVVADPHYSREPSVFCGVPAYFSSNDLRLATTFDQIVARHAGQSTPLPSLVLGGEHTYPGIAFGYSKIYGGHSSWITPTTPARKFVEPSQAFAQVFGNNRPTHGHASVLDAVREDAARLRTDLNPTDRRKLDEYQESIRTLEQRIERVGAARDPRDWQPARLSLEEMRAPINPNELRDRWDLLLDVAILALRSDRTRVISFMFENHRSYVSFDRLVPGASNFHGLTHDHGTRGQQYRDVVRFHMASLARFAQRMKECQEGEGTLLDHSMVVCASGLYHGGHHSADRLPVVLLGRGSGTIRPGRVIERLEGNGRELNSLYLALMQRMGVRADRFGDANQPLEGLS